MLYRSHSRSYFTKWVTFYGKFIGNIKIFMINLLMFLFDVNGSATLVSVSSTYMCVLTQSSNCFSLLENVCTCFLYKYMFMQTQSITFMYMCAHVWVCPI